MATKKPKSESDYRALVRPEVRVRDKANRKTTGKTMKPVTGEDANKCPCDPTAAIEWMESIKRLVELKKEEKQ